MYRLAQETTIPTPSQEVVVAVFQEEPALEVEEQDESPPRTRGDIIGYSDSDTEIKETTGDESDESIDITDINSNVKFLPATVDGRADRVNQLFKEFIRQGKHEHRNELVFLLDELLRQDDINRDEYVQVNNILAESLELEKSTKDEAGSTTIEDKSREGKLMKLIQLTTDSLIDYRFLIDYRLSDRVPTI